MHNIRYYDTPGHLKEDEFIDGCLKNAELIAVLNGGCARSTEDRSRRRSSIQTNLKQLQSFYDIKV